MLTISVFKLIDRLIFMLVFVYILTFTGTTIDIVEAANNGPFSGPNVALHMQATQSPRGYCEGYTCYGANRAVDGSTDGNFNNGHCSHTAGSQNFATWSVRFDRNYIISGIKIFNRNDLNKRRLTNFVLSGTLQNNQLIQLHAGGNISENSPSEIDIPLNDSNFYFGITIRVPPNHGEAAFLTLCEVQIFTAYCPAIILSAGLNAAIFQNTGNTFETNGSYQNTAGMVIVFSCSWAWYLHGPRYVKCLANGQYNDAIPSCSSEVPQCPALNLSATATIYGNYPRVGSWVSYYCGTGYKFIGSQRITCQNNGRWSSPPSTCEPVQCNTPAAVANGHYIVSNKEICGTDLLNNLHFRCKIRLMCGKGFRANINDESECMASGSWNMLDNACVSVHCNYPDRISNGQYVDSNQVVVDSSGTFTYGSVIHLKCDTGYTPIGDLLRFCQAHGNWSGQNPQCNIEVCSVHNLTLVHNGHFVTETGHDVGADVVNFNQGVQVKCNVGYKLHSNYTMITCLSGGKWSHQDANCSIITCPLPTAGNGISFSIPNKTSDGMFNADTLPFGTTIEVLCDERILVKGSGIQICNESGLWSGDDSVCAALCKAPSINHGYLIDVHNTLQHSYKEGENISLVCNAGYESKVGLETFTCIKDHTWNYKPQCIIRLCPPPEYVNNGVYMTMEQTFPFNTSVKLVCEDGYYIAAGNETRQCQENRTWSGRNPVCLKMENLQNHMSSLAGPIGGSIGGILLFGIVAIVLVIYKNRKSFSGLSDRNKTKRSVGWHKSRSEKYATIVVENTAIQETAIDEKSARPANTKEVYVQSSNGVYSNTDTSSNAYYSFSETERIPDSAILVINLSDIVLSGKVALKRLKDEFEVLPEGLTEQYSEAIKLQNRGKNRYKN